MRKVYLKLLFGVVFVVTALFIGQEEATSESLSIGISFADFDSPRWPLEQAIMTELAYEQGVHIISQVANHDAKLQNEQIRNMVMQGVDALIIVAEDIKTAASAVKWAVQNGVPCIAYDRLILSSKIAAYISFDYIEVGRVQALGVLKVASRGKFVLLNGDREDHEAALLREGQIQVLQPLVNEGAITIVANYWIKDWSSTTAAKIMRDILAAQKNDIDAVVASDDRIALGAIKALKTQGLVRKVPVSGHGATADGCKSIVEGELTITVLKDTRLLSPVAIDMAIKLAKDMRIHDLTRYTLGELTSNTRLRGMVPCKFLDVVEVTKDNIYEVIVKSGFQSYDAIYKDIPENRRPPRPQKIEN